MVTDDSDDEWLRELLQWDDDSMMSSAGESTTTAETPHVAMAISTPSSPTQVSKDAPIMRPQLIRLQTRRASGRLASTNYWKTYVPKSLHNMPGLASAVNDILAHPAIHLRVLADAVLGSKLLAHAHEVIGILAAEKQFKIGLTRSPLHRWENPAYGYELEGRWCSMVVVCILQHGESAAIMESALILTWGSNPRCASEGGIGFTRARTLVYLCSTGLLMYASALSATFSRFNISQLHGCFVLCRKQSALGAKVRAECWTKQAYCPYLEHRSQRCDLARLMIISHIPCSDRKPSKVPPSRATMTD